MSASDGGSRWLTVVSPDGPDDVELLLKSNGTPDAKTYQRALFEQRVTFRAEPTDVGARGGAPLLIPETTTCDSL